MELNEKSNELYARYTKQFSSKPEYIKEYRSISYIDLFDILCATMDSLYEDYECIEEYAEGDEPRTVMSIYSLNEAEYMVDALGKFLHSKQS